MEEKSAKKKSPSLNSVKKIALHSAIALALAAIILIVEFAILFSIGGVFDFGTGSVFGAGYVLKKNPGLYTIDNGNYKDFFVLVADSSMEGRSKVIEGAKRRYVPLSADSNMNDYTLFNIYPRSAGVSFFDLFETKLRESSAQTYDSSLLFGLPAPRYVITDLHITFEVRYSHNGVEQTAMVEKSIDNFFDNYYDNSIIQIDFPSDYLAIEEKITGWGEVFYRYYYPDLDYWSVKVLNISGTAEVKEVSHQ